MPWKSFPENDKHCVHKLNPDGSMGERVACHNTPAEATAQIRALYASERNMSASTYLLDEFATSRPGEPFRLFPFGKVIKGGRERHVTPELAHKFKLPHFRPAIKLGSHKDDAPAGGHMVKLEVRETGNPEQDGLWCWPEYNEKGTTAVTEGHYRYESPEVFWEGDAFEDPATGESIQGPLIVGAALLHMPHLGHAAALYSIEQQSGEGSPVNAPTFTEEIMSENTVNVPTSLLDRLLERFGAGNNLHPEPAPQPTPQRQPEQTPPAVVPEQFAALQETLEATKKEMEQYRAEAAQAKAENERNQRVTALAATVGSVEQYGTTFQGEAGKTAAQHLDGMTAETRDWAMQQFRSLYAVAKQGAAGLQTEIGNPGSPEGNFRNAAEEFNALVMAKVTASNGKVKYNDAVKMVVAERPDLAKGVA